MTTTLRGGSDVALQASLHRLRSAVGALEAESRMPAGGPQVVPDRIRVELPTERRPASRGRRTLRLAANALAATLAMSAVALVLVVAVGPRVLPYQAAPVTSVSMRPAIEPGSLILLSHVDAAVLDVGDVVTFESPAAPGSLVTRRIDDVERDADGAWLLTRGDAEPSRDPWRLRAVGSGWRASFVVPGVGHVLAAFSSGVARTLAVALSAAVFASTIARQLRARRRA